MECQERNPMATYHRESGSIPVSSIFLSIDPSALGIIGTDEYFRTCCTTNRPALLAACGTGGNKLLQFASLLVRWKKGPTLMHPLAATNYSNPHAAHVRLLPKRRSPSSGNQGMLCSLTGGDDDDERRTTPPIRNSRLVRVHSQ